MTEPIPHVLTAAVEPGCPRCYDNSQPCPTCQATAELLAIVHRRVLDLWIALALARVDELLGGHA